MLIDKCRIRSIIHEYMQESPYTIQYLDLDVLTERIWKYIERREDRIVFEVKSLNLNIIVAHPAWKRGFEIAIEQVIGLFKAGIYKAGDTVKVSSAVKGASDGVFKVIRGKKGYLILDDIMGTDLRELNPMEIQKTYEELCPVCHGAGATTDHHDPCTECGGSGKVGG